MPKCFRILHNLIAKFLTSKPNAYAKFQVILEENSATLNNIPIFLFVIIYGKYRTKQIESWNSEHFSILFFYKNWDTSKISPIKKNHQFPHSLLKKCLNSKPKEKINRNVKFWNFGSKDSPSKFFSTTKGTLNSQDINTWFQFPLTK